MAQRVLLYGGSFDPIHLGHTRPAQAVVQQLDVGRAILIPAARPPHKPGRRFAPVADRLAMCRLAVADNPRFEVSDWEAQRAGPTYTVDTVRHFRAQLGGDAWLGWLIGMDSLIDLPSWREVGALAELCTLVTAARPGFVRPDLGHIADHVSPAALERIRGHILATPEIDVSGSQIRARRAAGEPIDALVEPAVLEYIVERGLYA